MSERKKLNRREREALAELVNVCDIALSKLRRPLTLCGDDGMTTGARVFEDSVAVLGPLCGVRVKKEAADV